MPKSDKQLKKEPTNISLQHQLDEAIDTATYWESCWHDTARLLEKCTSRCAALENAQENQRQEHDEDQMYIADLEAERDKFRKQAAENLGELIGLRDKATFLKAENAALCRQLARATNWQPVAPGPLPGYDCIIILENGTVEIDCEDYELKIRDPFCLCQRLPQQQEE